MSYHFSNKVDIRFNDIDMIGHLYNAVYQEFFDFSRIQYFEKVLGKSINFTKTGLVIVSVTIDFFEPVYLHDTIQVYSATTQLGEKSLQMKQKMIKEGLDTPAAEAKASLVCFNVKDHLSIAIPKTWKEKIKYFEQL